MELIEKLLVELKELDVQWALCGGLAIDSFLGYKTRAHKDLDISVRFEDVEKVIDYLRYRGWKAYAPVGKGRFVEFTEALTDKSLYFDNVWCFKDDTDFITEDEKEGEYRFFKFERKEQKELDFIEVLCSRENSSHYIYLKNDKIRRCIEKAYIKCNGLRILAPEIILLYKSRTKDNLEYKQDFRLAKDKLSNNQREWLEEAFSIEYPKGHEWLN